MINYEKDASRTKVIEMFPRISNKLSRKKDNNKADAILIAQYFENTRENNRKLGNRPGFLFDFRLKGHYFILKGPYNVHGRKVPPGRFLVFLMKIH